MPSARVTEDTTSKANCDLARVDRRVFPFPTCTAVTCPSPCNILISCARCHSSTRAYGCAHGRRHRAGERAVKALQPANISSAPSSRPKQTASHRAPGPPLETTSSAAARQWQNRHTARRILSEKRVRQTSGLPGVEVDWRIGGRCADTVVVVRSRTWANLSPFRSTHAPFTRLASAHQATLCQDNAPAAWPNKAVRSCPFRQRQLLVFEQSPPSYHSSSPSSLMSPSRRKAWAEHAALRRCSICSYHMASGL